MTGVQTCALPILAANPHPPPCPLTCSFLRFSSEWPEFVDSYAPWWSSHALSWLRFGRRLLVVHYEDLQRALLPQVRLIGSFLNASMTEERLICARGHQEGHFKRSGAQKPSFDPFTPEMRSTIDAYILSVDRALRGRNVSGLPLEYLPR